MRDLCKEFGLDVSEKTTKKEMVKIIESYNAENPDDEIYKQMEKIRNSREKAETEKADLEKAKLEVERLQVEADIRKKQRDEETEEQLREVKLAEHQERLKQLQNPAQPTVPHSPQIDASKFISKFDEKIPIDRYLKTFESIAEVQGWPKEIWAKILPALLTGKSLWTYGRMPTDVKGSYDKIKEALLSTSLVTPEVYRMRFRSGVKDKGITYMEWSFSVQEAAKEWFKSKEADTVEKLEQLIIMEEFTRDMPRELKIHLSRQNPTTISEAATLADQFVASSSSDLSFHPASDQAQKSFSPRNKEAKRTWPPKTEDLRNTENKNNFKPSSSPVSNEGKVRARPRCSHCNFTGHTAETCYKLHPELRNVQKVLRVNVVGPREDEEVPPKPTSKRETTEVMVNRVISTLMEAKPRVRSEEITNRYLTEILVDGKPATAYKDTGADITIVRALLCQDKEKLPVAAPVFNIWTDHVIEAPLCEVELTINGETFPVVVGLAPNLPVDVLIGKDVKAEMESRGKKIIYRVQTRSQAKDTPKPGTHEGSYPVAQAPTVKEKAELESPKPEDYGEKKTDKSTSTQDRIPNDPIVETSPDIDQLTPKILGELQRRDKTLEPLFGLASKSRNEKGSKYLIKNDILYRDYASKKRPDEPIISQILVPSPYRIKLLQLAHDAPLGAHVGANRMMAKLTMNYWWTNMAADVANWAASCDSCQRAGKSNKPAPATLSTVPIMEEVFHRILIDAIGPFKQTRSGNRYAITVIDSGSRYMECIPLPNIKAETVADGLINQVFTRMGMPKEIQHDQALNFCNLLMEEIWKRVGVRQIKSSPYHPQTNSLVERANRTIKEAMRILTHENTGDWDEQLPYLLFALRESPCRTTGFSPFELMYGRHVRGPLDLIREGWEENKTSETNPVGTIEYVLQMREKMEKMLKLARETAEEQQMYQKQHFDANARLRTFQPGQLVLLLLPTQNKLQLAWKGPFKVLKRMNAVDYVIERSVNGKDHRTYHVNLLKEYIVRKPNICYINVPKFDESEIPDLSSLASEEDWKTMTLRVEEANLTDQQKEDLYQVLTKFRTNFSSVPGATNLVEHRIELIDKTPVSLAPYKTNPYTQQLIKQEIEKLRVQGIIKKSESPYASPLVMVQREGKEPRMCVDFRKVNDKTQNDAYCMKNTENLVDQIAKANFITVFDLARGFHQIRMNKESVQITAFSSPFGNWEYLRLPFGLKGSPSRFQRLMDTLLEGMESFAQAYIDDLAIFSDSWTDHLKHLEAVLTSIKKANLTIRPDKTQLCRSTVTYLSYEIGSGKLRPADAKVRVVLNYPRPTTKKEVKQFLGFTNYYSRYVEKYADIASPLTDLLKKSEPDRVTWTSETEEAFRTLCSKLAASPVVSAPDFSKPFIIVTDASDRAISSILVQMGEDNFEHPVAYLSRKLSPAEKNWSTIERELLAILYGVTRFKHYLLGSEFTVITDHRPLQYLSRMSPHNSRLLRWSLILSQYPMTIKHRPGSQNINADALSRIELSEL